MRFSISCLAALSILGAVACVHTPPGTSVELALAKKAELIRLPAAAATSAVAATAPKGKSGAAEGATTSAADKTELVADAYSRGDFCMNAGKDNEAITAFNEAVKLDPTFSEAWSKLALLYEKTGQEKLAIDAFKKSKTAPLRSASIGN